LTIAITRWGSLWRTVAILAVATAVLAAVDAAEIHDLGLMWISGGMGGVAACFAAVGLLVKMMGHSIHADLSPPPPPPPTPL
jgi:hypothetical protein